jgi:hypothetical protein
MTDAEHTALQLAEPIPERRIAALQDHPPELVGIMPIRQPHRRE